ncbi:hypothetical protein RQP53_12945 [Paucibacter sp. APW11]|uniref:Solute-binding protein family 3/N-terminal domain-containing protein n=1 Tax=Roseateles aquae TaxID=3077235 RepID=A0ABU3PCW0_9BURK|nr:hypothetical protein [Paucibacter sp. APW11]MDT9000177.1 hypothetical protein [Paucibacter sp. APW11]
MADPPSATRWRAGRRHCLALPAAAWLAGASAWASGAASSGQAARVIRLPYHSRFDDPQRRYVSRVIELAMKQAGVAARVEPVHMEIAQKRSLAELARGRDLFDLLWTVTDAEREASGLMGWRMLVVRQRELAQWQEVRTLDDLRRKTAGQGIDWPDTQILRANGLKVETGSGPDVLYRMLAGRRFDYFPRSILEIDAELTSQLASPRQEPVALVPDLLLHYPAAAYLFVSPSQPALAAELERGLDAAVRNGSLQRLHAEFYGAQLRAHLTSKRRVIQLSNPLLPAKTPVGRRELWVEP